MNAHMQRGHWGANTLTEREREREESFEMERAPLTILLAGVSVEVN